RARPRHHPRLREPSVGRRLSHHHLGLRRRGYPRETVNDGTTTTAYRYVHGPGIDEALARENAATGALQCYQADGLGSIVKMTDGWGALVVTRQYDAWSRMIQEAPLHWRILNNWMN